VVENRPGADGIVGITAFLAGQPDDHVLLFAPTGTFTAHPFLHEKLSYDPDRLVPIARITNTLIGVTAPTTLNVKSLAELIALIRSRPGRYHWASLTGATDLAFSGFLEHSGLSMVRVPYRESVLALNDLSEARIEVFLSAMATVLPQIAGGKIKVLALTNRDRAPGHPGCRMFPRRRKPVFPDCSSMGSSVYSRTRKCRSNSGTGLRERCGPSLPIRR
jgi:tripartite-type tricarboxylate transporter receptor subunit TctC